MIETETVEMNPLTRVHSKGRNIFSSCKVTFLERFTFKMRVTNESGCSALVQNARWSDRC